MLGRKSLGCKLLRDLSSHLKWRRCHYHSPPLYFVALRLWLSLQVYEFAKAQGFIPYDTCMTYLACSDDSKEGFCQHVDTTCQQKNICRTCSTFSSFGGTCSEVCCSCPILRASQHYSSHNICLHFFHCYLPNVLQIDFFPNATVAEHGTYNLLSFDRLHKIKSEIYSRGPVAVSGRNFSTNKSSC